MLCLARGKPHEGGTNASFLPCLSRERLYPCATNRLTYRDLDDKALSLRPHLCRPGPMLTQN